MQFQKDDEIVTILNQDYEGISRPILDLDGLKVRHYKAMDMDVVLTEHTDLEAVGYHLLASNGMRVLKRVVALHDCPKRGKWDIPLRVGDVVLVVAMYSDEWWFGEIDGSRSVDGGWYMCGSNGTGTFGLIHSSSVGKIPSSETSDEANKEEI